MPPWLFVDASMSYKSYIRGGDTLAESKIKSRALRHVSGKLYGEKRVVEETVQNPVKRYVYVYDY